MRSRRRGWEDRMTIRAITLKWWLRGRWWRLTNRDFREAWDAGTAGSSGPPPPPEPGPPEPPRPPRHRPVS